MSIDLRSPRGGGSGDAQKTETKAAVVFDGTNWPARPEGYASVEFIGGGAEDAPTLLMEDNDTWTPTEEGV